MNLLAVEFIVGRLLLACSATMLLPLLLSFLFAETDVLALLMSSSITAAIGYSMTIHGEHEPSLSNREAILAVCAGWGMVSLCGAFPYMFSKILPPFSAILESASGFTTVGMSLLTDLSAIPKSVLLWRNMTQWLGGMGVIVLFVSFLPQYGAGAISLFKAEPGPTTQRFLPHISDTVSFLWKIYIVLTVGFTFALMAVGLSPFDAVAHSMSSVANGGFSVYNDGMRHFDNRWAEILTAIITLAAALNFHLYHLLYVRGWRKAFADIEFRVFLSLIAGCTLLITFDLCRAGAHSLLAALYDAFFHTASLLSSSGIFIANLEPWPPFSKFIMFLLMFIGGCTASTAGGIKIIRVFIIIKQVWLEFKRMLHPKTILPLNIDGRPVDNTLILSTARFLFIYILVYLFTAATLTFCGMGFVEALLVAASVTGTAGTDIVYSMLGSTHSFADMHDAIKITLTFCMILARLEFFTVLILLRPEFWRKTRRW